MYQACLVSRKEELEQIAALSAQNLRTIISDTEKKEQGFITWEYPLPLLEAMHAIAPSVIIKVDDQVVAFALVALQEMTAVHPELNVMLQNLQTLRYRNRLLTEYRFYMMGQICIDKAHRGKGLFDLLYQHHKTVYRNQYDLLLTEISTSNHRSLRAHQRVGFETIHTYQDHLDEWDVVVWNFDLLDVRSQMSGVRCLIF